MYGGVTLAVGEGRSGASGTGTHVGDLTTPLVAPGGAARDERRRRKVVSGWRSLGSTVREQNQIMRSSHHQIWFG